MNTVRVWSDARGCWIDVSVERDHDRAFTKAKELESEFGMDTRISIKDERTGETTWVNQ